ncbi:MAG: hypothetical protein OXI39_08365 [Gemmatimonadota bacterium]|uniref:hypothetical protein n=1 Tax=Candidatus Palauibacter scopulicola TaxID=3056741 RepID=UPI00239A5CE9|nr:hypothetical protein [Candidatus Palauibacter scopulicola]MDE2663003.1 hypothetical protein [Candidatus Palauibacter scopulicola]
MRNRQHKAESPSDLDPTLTRRSLTFSQAEGLEDLPQPLSLHEVSRQARNLIWDVFWNITMHHASGYSVGHPWNAVLHDTHVRFFLRPTDEFSYSLEDTRNIYKQFIFGAPYNRLFDLLLHLMRQGDCPLEFIERTSGAFVESRLAYTIDTNGPPTILPTATPEEGEALQTALAQLSEAGFSGAREHLRKAGELINGGDWRGSIRESIHAVESVARRLDPGGAKTLGPAIDRLKREHGIHPALVEACKKLYGYTSDEDGIRHAALEDDAPVDQAEAVFLLGACASFVSYLVQKQPSK